MRTTIFGLVLIASLVAGCGKQSASEKSAPAASTSVAHPAMKAWAQDDKVAAVNSFVETDWNTHPMFPPGSPLAISEDQFKALSNDERQAKSKEIIPQMELLKQLVVAVAQAGRDAATKGDTAQARKYFTALKDCGSSLDNANSLALVRLVGQAMKKKGEMELSGLPK